MGQSIEDMYNDLLDMESIGNFLGVQNDDSEEVFVTSKEAAKAKKESEEVFGRKPATKADIDEEIHFTSYRKKRVHKYTETELAQIRESCMRTIVHDYGDNDVFHMSDEERRKNDLLAELSMKLGGLKRTYRSVDKYIHAMRIVVEAWKLLEKQANYLHDPDEFFAMVGDEKIVSNRIIMPKLKGINNYNMDQIIKYISNPDLDPADLMNSSNSGNSYDPDFDFIEDRPEYQEYFDEYMGTVTDEMREDMDEYDIRSKADSYAKSKIEEDDAMRLLSEDEVQYLMDYLDNPPEFSVNEIPRKYIKGYDTRESLTRGKKNKLSKSDRYIQRDVHDMLMRLQNNPAYRDVDDYNRSYIITHGMFSGDKPEKDFWDDLFFDGSWANDDQVYLYELASREELMKLHIPSQRFKTYGDVQLDEFFRTAEMNGINVIELRRKMNMAESGVDSKQEVKEKVKQNKKMEAQILQRLEKLNNDPKFKKLVEKSEKALNNFYSDQ